MPTYEYECQKCGHRFEAFQSMKDEPLSSCPKCDGLVKRLISGGAGVIFKGSGFYQTDYRSDSYKKRAREESGGKAAGEAGGKSAGESGGKSGEKSGGKAGGEGGGKAGGEGGGKSGDKTGGDAAPAKKKSDSEGGA